MAAVRDATNYYVPEIQVEFQKVDIEKHEVEEGGSISTSSTESEDEKKAPQLKLLPRTHYFERLDSGSSVGEEEEPIELTDELREKIITQAEYYFSDENLKKDGFLLKHVKRNKEGYVNLKLLASFKKMRSLSRDYRVIGEALRNSRKLVINDTGLKLKRVTPLPKELLDQVRVKHIVLTKIPNEIPSMNFIAEAFTNHKDDVVSVRIIKSGKKFPNDLQSHFSRHPELRNEVVAVVEFENPDVANEAIKTTFSNEYEGLVAKLLELGPKQAKKINSANNSDAADSDSAFERQGSGKSKKNTRLLEVSGTEDYPSSSSDNEFSAFSSCNKRYNRSRGNSPSTSPNLNRRNENGNSKNNSRNSSPNISPKTSPNVLRKNKTSTESKQNNNHHKLSPLINGVHQKGSPNSSPEFERRSKSRNNSNNGRQSHGNSPEGKGRSKYTENPFRENNNKEVELSPWLQRRMMTQKNENNKNSSLKGGMQQLEIIRQPRGPDGSMGFSNHPLKKYVLVHAY